MNKLYKEIGHRITMLRYENELTQAKLAELLDISVKHCSEVERGLAGLSLEKLVEVCPILSTNLDYLVRGIDARTDEESNIPFFAIELFNTSDQQKAELLHEYMRLFKKISELK